MNIGRRLFLRTGIALTALAALPRALVTVGRGAGVDYPGTTPD